MTRRALLIVLFVLFPLVSIAQQGAVSPIDGVWKITDVTTTGANAASNPSPQPSLIIFARGHYSWLSVGGTTPRKQRGPLATPGKPTDAEKLAAHDEWLAFTANSGTYELKGDMVTRRASVAKNVGAMSASSSTVQQFKLEGDTLWLTQRSAAGQPASETRWRLTRVR
jgi:hypothetical protein